MFHLTCTTSSIRSVLTWIATLCGSSKHKQFSSKRGMPLAHLVSGHCGNSQWGQLQSSELESRAEPSVQRPISSHEVAIEIGQRTSSSILVASSSSHFSSQLMIFLRLLMIFWVFWNHSISGTSQQGLSIWHWTSSYQPSFTTVLVSEVALSRLTFKSSMICFQAALISTFNSLMIVSRHFVP